MSHKLDLNSVERFRKQSERLVLEEYSHCEVPAGCGGVVLRWRNPQALQWATIWLYTPVEAKVLLDGQPLGRGRVDLTVGRHVLTITLECNVDLSAGLLLFAGVMEAKKNISIVREQPVRVLSAADGSWKYLLDTPAAEWTTLAFDDTSWHALTKHPRPTVTDLSHRGAYSIEQCVERGAICLGLPLPADVDSVSWWQRLLGRTVKPHESVLGNVWIRKVFDVVAPSETKP